MDEVFDEAELLRTVQGDRDLLKELGVLFLNDAPAQLEAVRSAIERNDAQALRFAAHALKGSAATLTARRVASTAYALEHMGANGNLTGARDGLAAVESAIGELRVRLGALGGS